MPTRARSKTSKIETSDDDYIVAAAASREALAEAERIHRERIKAGKELLHPTAIKAAWMRGVDKYSALDYVASQADAERSDLLIAAGRKAVDAARKALIPSDLSLAQAAAVALGELFELDAEAVAVEPKEFTYSEGAAPRIVVVQKGPHQTHDDGAMTGTLTVHLVRGEWHKQLSGKAVLDGLEGLSWLFAYDADETVLTLPCEGGEVDELRVEVGRGYPALPSIAEHIDADDLAASVGGLVRGAYVESVYRTGIASPKVSTDLDGPAEIVADHEVDGVRQVDAEVELILTISPLCDVDAAIEDIRGAIDRLAGRYCTAGRIERASLMDAGPVTGDGVHPDGVGLTVRVVAVSQAVSA